MLRLLPRFSVSLALLMIVMNFDLAPYPVAEAMDGDGLHAIQSEPRARSPLVASAPAGVVTPTVYLPITTFNFDASYVNPFGIVMYSNVDDANGLGHMGAAGSRWVTTRLTWSAVEPNPPAGGIHTYDWRYFDRIAQNAQAAGMRQFVLVTGNPAWAAAYPGGPVTDTAQLISFATVMAERYDGDGVSDAAGSPVIDYWSMYGEPDNAWEGLAVTGKGWWGHQPAAYAQMYQHVAQAIHAANPAAKVLIGGLAYDWFTSDTPPGAFVQSFLGDVLAALNTYPGGATRYVDAVAIHYYPISPGRWPTIREKLAEIKDIMNAHGVGGLPLMVPEMGYWSDTAYGSSETIQARRLVQMYVRGLSMGVQHLSWYQVFDQAASGTETVGLFRGADLGQPRPAYDAYATMTAELSLYRFDHDLVVPGAEGYVFRSANGENKTVLWARSSPVAVPLLQSCARHVDLLGGVLTIVDGGPGDVDAAVNGQVAISLGVNEAVYLGSCP